MSKVLEASRAERLRIMTSGLRLPLIAAPMSRISGPTLALAASRAGIVGAYG